MKEYIVALDKKLEKPEYVKGIGMTDIKRIVGKIKISDQTTIEKVLVNFQVNHNLKVVNYAMVGDDIIELEIRR